MFETFQQLTGMGVTLQQVDTTMDLLECTLQDPLGTVLLQSGTSYPAHRNPHPASSEKCSAH